MNNKFKVSLTAALVSTAMFANAGISIVDNENGNFSIGGDVEFDFNYEKLGGENGNKDYNFNQNGRILLEFQGERFTSNGNVLQVNVQPLMESSGDVNLDDAWFALVQVVAPHISVAPLDINFHAGSLEKQLWNEADHEQTR